MAGTQELRIKSHFYRIEMVGLITPV